MSEQNLSHRIINNISWNFLGQGWLILLSFFATPYIVHHLNVNLYGIYTLISVIIGYFSFLQLGLVHAVIKYVAQYLAVDDREKVAKTFWACAFAYIALGAIAVALIFSCSGLLIERFFKLTDDFRQTAVFALRIAALGFFATMLTNAMNGAIRAVGRFDLLNRAGLILGTLQILLTIALLWFGYSLKEIFVVNLVLQVIGVFLFWRILARLLPFITTPVWDWRSLTELLKYGKFVTVYSATDPVLANTEKIFLSSLRSVTSLTYYAIPQAVVSKLAIIPSAVMTVLFPIFSRFRKLNNTAVNRELHMRSVLYMLYIYTFIFFLFATYGTSFFDWWIGIDFARRSSTILIILTGAGFLGTMAQPSTTLLLGLGKPQYPALFNIIEVVFYLPFSYLLINAYGGIGAAWAWLLCTLINAFLVNMTATRMLGQSVVSFYREILTALIPPAVICGVSFWILRQVGLPSLHPLKIIGIILIAALYGYIIWRWRLDHFAKLRLLECFGVRASGKRDLAACDTVLPGKEP